MCFLAGKPFSSVPREASEADSGVTHSCERRVSRHVCKTGGSLPGLRYEMVSSLSTPSAFIRVIEAFASDFSNRVDCPSALIALFSAGDQTNPPPCFLVTGKAERGCPGSVQDERDVSSEAQPPRPRGPAQDRSASGSEFELHIICDNYSTHKHAKVKAWLKRHPRFHIHFIPTSSSWLNLVEPFFGEITPKVIRRGSFRSVGALVADIFGFLGSSQSQSQTLPLDCGPQAHSRKTDRAWQAMLEEIYNPVYGTSH